MDGWMDGWMAGWMDGYIDIHTHHPVRMHVGVPGRNARACSSPACIFTYYSRCSNNLYPQLVETSVRLSRFVLIASRTF